MIRIVEIFNYFKEIYILLYNYLIIKFNYIIYLIECDRKIFKKYNVAVFDIIIFNFYNFYCN